MRHSVRLRELVKSALRGFATVLVLPCLVWFRVCSALFKGRRDQVLQGVSQFLALIPGVLGSYLRVAFYRRVFLGVGADVFIGFGTIFATPEVRIGNRVYIGPFCNIGHVDFGEDVLLGSNVTILSGNLQHGFDRLDIPINQQPGTYERVDVGADCWLGNGAIVMAAIGDRAIVAAGAVVTKPVSMGDIVGGNPARHIKSRLPARDVSSLSGTVQSP